MCLTYHTNAKASLLLRMCCGLYFATLFNPLDLNTDVILVILQSILLKHLVFLPVFVTNVPVIYGSFKVTWTFSCCHFTLKVNRASSAYLYMTQIMHIDYLYDAVHLSESICTNVLFIGFQQAPYFARVVVDPKHIQIHFRWDASPTFGTHVHIQSNTPSYLEAG